MWIVQDLGLCNCASGINKVFKFKYTIYTFYFRFIITVNFPHSNESAASIDMTLVGCYDRFLGLLPAPLQLWHDWRSSVTPNNMAVSVWLQIKEKILLMQSYFPVKVLDITLAHMNISCKHKLYDFKSSTESRKLWLTLKGLVSG